MGRKRGKYQKNHGQYEKLKNFFALFAIVFVGFLLIKIIIDKVEIIHNIRQDTLETYTGSYSCELKRTYGRHRHHYYLISLD